MKYAGSTFKAVIVVLPRLMPLRPAKRTPALAATTEAAAYADVVAAEADCAGAWMSKLRTRPRNSNFQKPGEAGPRWRAMPLTSSGFLAQVQT